MTRRGWLKRRIDEERREEGAVARWLEKELFLAEGGGVTVWKQTGKARAQTPPPSPRTPVVGAVSTRGRCGQSRELLRGDSGFSTCRR